MGADGALSPYDKLVIGPTSVKVVADTTRTSRAIVMCEQILYTLEFLGRRGTFYNPVILNKVWLTDPRNPAFMQRPWGCFTQAASRIPHGYSRFGAGSLFCLAGSSLLLADLSTSPEPDMVPRRMPLNGTPTRVLYSEELKNLIVLYTITTVDRRQRRRLQPAIALIDPDAETVRSDLHEEDTLNVLESSHFKDDERFLGIMEWLPIGGDRRYHFLVINTIRQREGEEATGRLLILSPNISSAGKITLTLKKDRDRGDPPIWCMAPHGDSSLVYACGSDIILRRLDMRTREFDKPATLALRSPATHISVEGDFLHVSTKGSGYHNLVITDGGRRLSSVCAEASGRSNIYHLSLSNHSLVVTTDNECRVAGLWRRPHAQVGNTAPVLFETTLPGSITKLCEIGRPMWHGHVSAIDVQRTALLGTSEDGAIYQLTILRESMWKLLAFIQNMAARDPRICPYASPLVHERHIEPPEPKKHNMHINGDILSRLLEWGSASVLEEMLSKEPDPDNRSSDYTTAHDRQVRFRELWRAAMDDYGKPLIEDAMVEDAIAHLRGLLLSAI